MTEILSEIPGFKILKPIRITVEKHEWGYVVSVSEANINASGETEAEAITNLQDMIIATYRILKNEPKIGSDATHQKEYLESHLKEFSKDD